MGLFLSYNIFTLRDLAHLGFADISQASAETLGYRGQAHAQKQCGPNIN